MEYAKSISLITETIHQTKWLRLECARKERKLFGFTNER